MPPLLDAVLLDYQRNFPTAREPEVLSTMATIVNKLEVRILLLLNHFLFLDCRQKSVHTCCLSSLFHVTVKVHQTSHAGEL